jgi:hypothetical protein
MPVAKKMNSDYHGRRMSNPIAPSSHHPVGDALTQVDALRDFALRSTGIWVSKRCLDIDIGVRCSRA